MAKKLLGRVSLAQAASTNVSYALAMKQWHPTKNGALTPAQVSFGSDKRCWWKCSQGHEWEAMVSHRTVGGKGCPFCAGRAVLPGFNDLATTYPDVAAQWNSAKNGNLRPTDVVAGSDKRVWWKCEHGHEWQTKVSHRCKKGTGCPVCTGRVVLPGFNDMATTHPHLAEQWHPTKNGALTPQQIGAGAGRRCWWKCSQGHEWSVSPSSRSRRKTGCPKCCLRSTSKMEETFRQRLLASEVLQVTSADHTARVPVADFGNGTAQVDIMGALACGHTVVIQYDGSYWHNLDGARERDLRATRALIAAGYTVVRIRETTKEHTLPFLQWEHKNLLQLRYEFQRSEDYTGMLKVIHRIEEWLGRHECFTDVP